jgi:hypothetical protein
VAYLAETKNNGEMKKLENRSSGNNLAAKSLKMAKIGSNENGGNLSSKQRHLASIVKAKRICGGENGRKLGNSGIGGAAGGRRMKTSNLVENGEENSSEARNMQKKMWRPSERKYRGGENRRNCMAAAKKEGIGVNRRKYLAKSG